MNPQNEKRQNLVYWLSLGSAVLALAAVFVIGAFEMYIRWKISKDFTLLGGAELEVLTASAFAMLLGLTYWNRSR